MDWKSSNLKCLRPKCHHKHHLQSITSEYNPLIIKCRQLNSFPINKFILIDLIRFRDKFWIFHWKIVEFHRNFFHWFYDFLWCLWHNKFCLFRGLKSHFQMIYSLMFHLYFELAGSIVSNRFRGFQGRKFMCLDIRRIILMLNRNYNCSYRHRLINIYQIINLLYMWYIYGYIYYNIN